MLVLAYLCGRQPAEKKLRPTLLRNPAGIGNSAAMSNPTTELLSVPQAAAEIGMPARTLLYQITTGKVDAVKLGTGTSPWVLTRETVDALKGEREAAS